MRSPSEASGPSQLWRQARQPTKSLRTRCSAWDFLLCVAVTAPELMIFIKKCCDGWHSRKHCTVWHRHFSAEKSEERKIVGSAPNLPAASGGSAGFLFWRWSSLLLLL